jgi:peroxiredoxin
MKMKTILTCCLLAAGLFGVAQSGNLKPGTVAPDFNLKNVTGETVSFASFKEAKGYILVFTCNTCPYAKAYENRIIALNSEYAPLGFPVIAINTNDPDVSTGDSFDAMVERAKSKKFMFPYLFDDGQKITTAYGARNTPTIFLVKRSEKGNIIVYTGAIDNDPEGDRTDKVNYVQQAISAVQEGKDPAVATTKAIGCTVKRKKSA